MTDLLEGDADGPRRARPVLPMAGISLDRVPRSPLYRKGSDAVRGLARRAGWIDLARTLVVFTADQKMLRRMTVAGGPCVPVGSRALVGPSRQDYGDTFDDIAELAPLLTGQPAPTAWQNGTQEGLGELRQMTPEFASALAGLAVPGDYDESMRVIRPLAERWLEQHRWPRGMEVGGLTMRLHSWSLHLTDGLARERQGYCWRGPSVEAYVAVSSRR